MSLLTVVRFITEDQVWEFSKITQLNMGVIMVGMELSVVSRTSEWLKLENMRH
jgi:hypothetical protein